MWTLIILVVLVVIIKFVYDRHQQAKQVAKQGGMRNKYRELIEILMSGDERSQIYELTLESVTLGSSGLGGINVFGLTQTFGNLTVQWRMDSPVFGKHKMEWRFPEYMDQSRMAEIIIDECAKYQKNVVKASGFGGLIDQ